MFSATFIREIQRRKPTFQRVLAVGRCSSRLTIHSTKYMKPNAKAQYPRSATAAKVPYTIIESESFILKSDSINFEAKAPIIAALPNSNVFTVPCDTFCLIPRVFTSFVFTARRKPRNPKRPIA